MYCCLSRWELLFSSLSGDNSPELIFYSFYSTNSLTEWTWLAIPRVNSNKNMTMNTVNHCQWCLVRWQMRIFFYQPSSTTLWSGYRTCKFKFGWWQQWLVLWQETRTGLFFVLFQTSATGPVDQWPPHAWKASKKGFQSCIIASLLFMLWSLHYLHFISLTLDPTYDGSIHATTSCHRVLNGESLQLLEGKYSY